MTQLISGQMAQQIVDTIKSVCDHDINFISETGRILASTNPDRAGDIHESGRLAALRREMVQVNEDQPLTGIRRGINLPVEYQEQVAGVIGITGNPEEVRRYAVLAKRITLLLIREGELERQTADRKARMQYAVQALIRREPLSPSYLEEVLAEQNVENPNGLWRTVLVQSRRPGKSLRDILPNAEAASVAGRLGPSLYAWVYPDQLVMLVPEPVFIQQQGVLQGLAAKHAGQLGIGIGSSQELNHQYRSFAAAETAVKNCREGRALVWYDQLDLDMILSEVPEDIRQNYVKRCLQGLTKEDHSLLLTYFDCGMRLKETAEKRYLHKNTLQYRLNRIRERCGYDPREFKDAVILYTAEKLRTTWPQT